MQPRKTDEVYPSFPGEGEQMRSLRRETQKPFSREDFVTFYFLRPVSIYLSLWITKQTKLSANQITYLMAILAFVAPVLVFFQKDLSSTVWVGMIMYHIVFMLDMVDGEVARLRGTVSKKGEIVDATLWFLLPTLYGVYSIKILQFIHYEVLEIAVVMVIVSSVMTFMLQKIYPPEQNISKYIPTTMTFRGRIQYMLRYLLSQGGIYLVAPLWYVSGMPAEVLVAYWVITLPLYFFYSFLRLKNVLKDVDNVKKG